MAFPSISSKASHHGNSITLLHSFVNVPVSGAFIVFVSSFSFLGDVETNSLKLSSEVDICELSDVSKVNMVGSSTGEVSEVDWICSIVSLGGKYLGPCSAEYIILHSTPTA